MVQLDEAWQRGLIARGGVIMTLSAGFSWWMWGWEVGGAVAAGLLVMLVNLVGLAWLLRKTFSDEERGSRSAWWLSLLFLAKLLVLFGLSYYVLAVVGLSPVGFATGCLLGLVVLSWQVLGTPTEKPE